MLETRAETGAVVAVCIATCRRANWLSVLLRALSVQQLPPGAEQGIIVADNDPLGSAKEAVERFSRSSLLSTTYVHEPRPGIAQARNAALAAVGSRATHIAFLDDDEVPEPNWLMNLLSGISKFESDVCAGPVLPRFVEPPPEWVVRGRFFERSRHPTGTKLTHAFTNNVLFRRTLIDGLAIRFNTEFSRTGGEDREFFRRIGLAGKRIIWIDEAIVHEWVPPDRMTSRYLVTRMRRIGMAISRVELSLAPPQRKLLVSVVQLAKSVVWMGIGLITAPLGILGFHHWVRARRAIAYGAGVFFGVFGRRLEMYGTDAAAPHQE